MILPHAMRALAALLLIGAAPSDPPTRTADNGDGTFTNPLFYEDSPDPDVIRVGNDYYMTNTSMHSMPGLAILHSRDLVNWTFLGYALDKLDLGPEARLEGGRQMYGQGIWAPSLRYHDGTFYIFANVNGHTTQVFRATNPAGPWRRTPMKRSLHDLSVLFDDDGKVYAVWGYRDLHLAQLNAALDDIVPGTERVIITADQGMGEGSHLYRIKGRYYISSAWFAGRMRMAMARADAPYGPYEVNPAVSIDEGFGLYQGERLRGDRGPPFTVLPPNRARGRTVMHQGGIVDTPDGQWWGFSMMDYNSLGRATALSPVTWRDGWPYFGLPGNPGRTPRTWVKPTLPAQPRGAPYRRSDDFASPTLAPIWQWSHVPDDGRWSLSARRGYLRLSTAPATGLFAARNTLTQRAAGPRSRVTVTLDGAGLRDGDSAGLALFSLPYAELGLVKRGTVLALRWFDQLSKAERKVSLRGPRIWLRADTDFLTERARFSYSVDGATYRPIGAPMRMIFQTTTFQGVRYGLYAYNRLGRAGGFADFDAVDVAEPAAAALTKPIPVGRALTVALGRPAIPLASRDGAVVGDAGAGLLTVTIEPRPLGRVTLAATGGHLSVTATGDVWIKPGAPGDGETFAWMETVYGQPILMSLVTDRYLAIDPASGLVTAWSPGPQPDGPNVIEFSWADARR